MAHITILNAAYLTCGLGQAHGPISCRVSLSSQKFHCAAMSTEEDANSAFWEQKNESASHEESQVNED